MMDFYKENHFNLPEDEFELFKQYLLLKDAEEADDFNKFLQTIGVPFPKRLLNWMNSNHQIRFYIVQNSKENNFLSKKFKTEVHQHFDNNPYEYFIVEEWIGRNVKKVMSLEGILNCPFFATVKEAVTFLKKTIETHPNFHQTELVSVKLIEEMDETYIFNNENKNNV